MDVRYVFERIAPTEQGSSVRPDGYAPMILAGQKVRLPVASGTLGVYDWMASFAYESISGRRYTSTLKIEDKVITEYRIATPQIV